jgi:arylsulfatase
VELAGLKLPAYIKGIKQDTLQGTSLAYSITDAKLGSRHALQYYYIFGARSIYYNGWKAEAAHHPDYIDLVSPVAGEAPVVKNYDNDVWELYNLTEDFNERNDLAKKYPEKLAELKRVFDTEAQKNHIYPFIDFDDVFKRKLHHPDNKTASSR